MIDPIAPLEAGLGWLLDALRGAVGHVGLAIVLLALTVKLLLAPLAMLAQSWQRDVQRIRAKLAPDLALIRAEHRGAERHRRIVELHQRVGVSPYFALRELLGVAVQVPIFLAAYHLLRAHDALAGQSFLWIDDLAHPDRIATLPWLGGDVHGLPVLMTTLALLSSCLLHDPELDAGALRRQKRGLYALALAFLVLLYRVPAGLVLYWTTHNLVSLLDHALRAGARAAATR